jgi:hypothetical protein
MSTNRISMEKSIRRCWERRPYFSMVMYFDGVEAGDETCAAKIQVDMRLVWLRGGLNPKSMLAGMARCAAAVIRLENLLSATIIALAALAE